MSRSKLSREFNLEPQETGPSIEGFEIGQKVRVPGDRKLWRIVGVDHPKQTFLLEEPGNDFPLQRRTVSLAELRGWNKPKTAKKI